MKPRVVLIHPHCFSPRDMQFYAPLQDEFDLVAVTPRWQPQKRAYDRVPQIPLVSVDQVVGALGPMQRVVDKAFRLRSENLYYFLGMEQALKGAAIVECLETFHPYCRQALDLKAKLGYKLVFSVHENVAFAHENLALRRDIKRRAFENADAFTAMCEQGRNSLILEGAPADRIHLSGAGVDTDALCPGTPDPEALAPLALPAKGDGELYLLFAGRLVWEKGIFDALEALALLSRADKTTQYRLLVAGDGPEDAKLRALAARAGVTDRVHFLGRVSAAQMVALYRLADLCLAPSIPTPRWQEQFGCVLIESMACGCPVVATHTGSIPEVVGDIGFLVAPNHHTQLADTIRRAAAQPEDRQDRARRGRDWVVERYDNRAVAGRIAQVYRNILKLSRHNRAC